MLRTIKLDGELEQRFEAIKHRLADQLESEPTNEEVLGILMEEYASQKSRTDVREEQPSALED